jgi:hypothetical protein
VATREAFAAPGTIFKVDSIEENQANGCEDGPWVAKNTNASLTAPTSETVIHLSAVTD